jgi:hypothetical protein
MEEDVMKSIVMLGAISAVSVGALMWLSGAAPALGLIPWISLISAAAYFTVGGGLAGIMKPLTAGALAIVLTGCAMSMIGAIGGGIAPTVLVVAALAFIIVLASSISLFAHLPSAFMAASTYVGASGSWGSSMAFIVVSWVSGLGLAWVIDTLSRTLQRTVVTKAPPAT